MDVTDHKRLSNTKFSISQSQYLHLQLYLHIYWRNNSVCFWH